MKMKVWTIEVSEENSDCRPVYGEWWGVTVWRSAESAQQVCQEDSKRWHEECQECQACQEDGLVEEWTPIKWEPTARNEEQEVVCYVGYDESHGQLIKIEQQEV